MSFLFRIDVGDNKVIITDLMEREQVIDGDLLFVDLLGAKAIIKEHI